MHRIKYSYHDIIALEGSRSCGSVPVAFLPETEPFLEDTVQLAVALTLLCQRLYENLSGACLHLCTAGEPAPALPMAPPVNKMRQDANEPQDSIREDHPYRILHSLEVTVPISIFVDVHLADNAKECDPENEEDQIPGPHQGKAKDKGDAEEDGRQGGETTHDLGVYPFPISIDVGLPGAVEVNAIKSANCDCEDELREV
jgi:hypothetical protein